MNKLMTNKSLILMIISIITLVLLILVPFTVNRYIYSIIISLMITALLGQSWNLMSGYAGQFSFGHATFFGLGAYTSTYLYTTFDISPWLGMICGMLVAAFVGIIIGYLSFRYKLRGDFFALVTLAFAELFRVLFNNLPTFGGAMGILLKLPLEDNIWMYEFTKYESYYFVILILVILATVFIYFLSKNRFGLNLIAIKTNINAAGALGVNVLGNQLLAMAISAAIAAAAGTFYAQYYGFIDPTVVFESDISVRAIVPCIIGGSGTAFGPLLGALVIVPLQEICNSLFEGVGGLNMILYGVLIVVFVLFCPEGITGLIRKVIAKRKGILK